MERLLLRPEEAAKLLGVGRSKLYQLLAAGDIPCVMLGSRCRRVPLDALRRWVEAHAGDPTDAATSPAG